jgi:hypothetical protein
MLSVRQAEPSITFTQVHRTRTQDRLTLTRLQQKPHTPTRSLQAEPTLTRLMTTRTQSAAMAHTITAGLPELKDRLWPSVLERSWPHSHILGSVRADDDYRRRLRPRRTNGRNCIDSGDSLRSRGSTLSKSNCIRHLRRRTSRSLSAYVGHHCRCNSTTHQTHRARTPAKAA